MKMVCYIVKETLIIGKRDVMVSQVLLLDSNESTICTIVEVSFSTFF